LNQTDNIIEISAMHFSREDRVIYNDINLSVPRGKVTAIMGPSGIGKTTLLRLIGGQISPSSGSIKFNNEELVGIDRKSLYKARRKMGMLFQSGAMFTELTVFENIAFPIREHTDLPESIIRKIVLMKLEAVGLRGAAQLFPSELSGGMARRAALARAIALDPDLIMYDEPFTGQDPISMGVIVSLIRELNDALGVTSIVVSHDVDEVLSIADYVYIIANKTVIAKGTPEELRQETSPQIVQFMHGRPDGPVAFHYPSEDYKKELFNHVD
jgi:phospholipid/cholesterol/gamma-HCH transport system ATP-binding protein